MIAAKLYELATENYLKFDTCLEKKWLSSRGDNSETRGS